MEQQSDAVFKRAMAWAEASGRGDGDQRMYAEWEQ